MAVLATIQSIVEHSAWAVEIFNFVLADGASFNLSFFGWFKMIPDQSFMTFATVDNSVGFFTGVAFSLRSHPFGELVKTYVRAVVGASTELKVVLARKAWDGLEEAELLSLQTSAAERARDISSPLFATRASDSFTWGERFEMVFRLLAGGADREYQFLLAAAAIVATVPLVNHSRFIQFELAAAGTGEIFEGKLALFLFAGDHLPHGVVRGLFVEDGLAGGLGAEEEKHLFLAHGAGDFLTEVGFLEEDGGIFLEALRALVQFPEDEAAFGVADIGGEDAVGELAIGYAFALGADRVLHSLVYLLSKKSQS